MKNKILLLGGILLLLFSPTWGEVLISTYRVDGWSSNAVEIGATFEVSVYYRNNTGATQTIVGALFYFNYDTTYLDAITDAAITTDSLGSYLTSKTNADFNATAGQFRYQRDAGSGSGITIASGASLECFKVQFHVKQNDSLAGSRSLFSWVYPSSENVILTVAGGTNVTGIINDFQSATLKASHRPTFGGVGSVTDAQTGNSLTISWPLGASVGSSNHDNDGSAYNDTTGAATYFSNSLLKHRVYRDGTLVHTTSTGGSASWTESGINDMQEYTYNVEAIDNCAPTPNESSSGVTLTGTAHDYTAPGAEIRVTSTADQQINLSWGTTDAGDLGGYIVIRRALSSGESITTPPDIGGATGNSNGTSPADTKAQLVALGWTVVAEGTTTSLSDTGLDNSKTYYYYVYAYDKTANEGATSPVQQGYNYSKAGTSGVPGAAPDAITEFCALSNLANGITLQWKTASPPNYAGAKIVYTTNYHAWTQLTTTSPEVVDYPFSGGTSTVTESVSWESLNPEMVYYFAAFAHNSSNLLWSSPVYTAALPGRAATTEVTTTTITTVVGTQAVEVTLVKQSSGYGINLLAIPFSPLYINNTLVSDLEDLVNAINAIAGKKVVTAVGFWDETNQTLKGATFNSSGTTTYISSGLKLADVALSLGDAFQVSVSENVNFTLRNYSL